MGIADELAQMDGYRTFLALPPATDLQPSILEALDYITRKLGSWCVYVSLNKPARVVEELLRERGVPLSKVYLVDCATCKIVRVPERPNLAFVSRPYNLTDISICIAQFARRLKGEGFVLVDSLDVLRVYTSPELVMQFIHSLASFPVKYGVRLVVFGTFENFRNEMGNFAQYFDRVSQVSSVGLRKHRPERLSA
jgi:hypothetical protein